MIVKSQQNGTELMTRPGQSFRETLADFERAYLSRSLSRLFDPVNLMFATNNIKSGGSVGPTGSSCQALTREELEGVFRAVSSELTIAAKVDQSGLRLSVAKNVAKTVKLMCNKCEQAREHVENKSTPWETKFLYQSWPVFVSFPVT